MKKIFAIALAVVMVLSIASVAGALWEPTPADPATDFRIQVSVEKYALETGTYGYKYVATETITAANGADVYYVVKATLPSDPNTAEQAAEVTVKYDGIEGTSFTWEIDDLYRVTDNKGGTIYYDGKYWQKAETYASNPGDVVVQARCFDTTVASIDVEASAKRNLKVDDGFEWKGYTVYYSGTAIAFVKDGERVRFTLGSDGLATFDTTTSTGLLPIVLFNDLGFTYDELKDGKVYMTEKNLRTVFGFSYKVTDSVDWTATNYPIIVDTNVGIPKTGDNASVIGFAMIMVAVVAAAVAVRKVNA